MEVEFVDFRDPASVVDHLKPSTRMVWVESPTNPTLDLVDLSLLAENIRHYNQVHQQQQGEGTFLTNKAVN